MATAALSPSSSPRLPSPPPMAEDQTGPQSPAPPSSALSSHGKLVAATSSGHGHGDGADAARRIRPGTKGVDMLDGPPLVPLADIDSPFQLTEHLQALHHHHTHPSPATTAPVTRATALLLSTCPPAVDKSLWLYELCRFLVEKVNIFVVSLFADSPPCSSVTCSEMRASEWQYLCAVHDPPKSCCAIDYCCHTLDWAGNTLTSPRNFPSRLVPGGYAHGRVGSGDSHHPSAALAASSSASTQQQTRQLSNIFRRVYRIFAHAWFQHREVFWRVEGRTGLYTMFKTVCDVYQLIPEDNYTIPPEAEGLDAPLPPIRSAVAGEDSPSRSAVPNGPQRTGSVIKDPARAVPAESKPSSILRRPQAEPIELPVAQPVENAAAATKLMTPGTSVTARRHKHSPSKGAPVSTVLEENEDEDELVQSPTKQTSQIRDAQHTASVLQAPPLPPPATAEVSSTTTTTTTTDESPVNDVGSSQFQPTDIAAADPSGATKDESLTDGEEPISAITSETSLETTADPVPHEVSEAPEQAAPSAIEVSVEELPLLDDIDGDTADAAAGVEATHAEEDVGVHGAVSSGSAAEEDTPGIIVEEPPQPASIPAVGDVEKVPAQ